MDIEYKISLIDDSFVVTQKVGCLRLIKMFNKLEDLILYLNTI